MKTNLNPTLERLLIALVAVLMVAPVLIAQHPKSESISFSEQILALQNQMLEKDSDAYERLQKSELMTNAIPMAQTGSITGRITDAFTEDALFGASVLVENTSIGTATNIDGEYTLQQLPAGEQILIVRYLGYMTKNIEVTIAAGETIERDISLEPAQVEGEEVVIGAQALGQARAIRDQLSSNTIVNVVSEARLREMPDANVAESVGRLPGVSIIRDAGEGQMVTIRGMGPQYSSITIDGNRIPSTDLENRSVDLSMITPDMISGIEVYKSLRPDMDADAIGGSVNFSVGGAPPGAQINIDLSGGYNNIVDGLASRKASVRASNRFFNDRLGILGVGSFQRVPRNSHVFQAGYEVLRDAREGEAHPPMEINSMSLTDRAEIRDRYGVGLNLDMKIPGGHLYLVNFLSRLDRDEWWNETSYNPLSARVDWRFRDRDIHVDVLTNTLRGEHDLWGAEIDWHISRSATTHDRPFSNEIRFVDNNAFNNSILDLSEGPDNLYAAATPQMDRAFINDLNHPTTGSSERDLMASFDMQIPISLMDNISGYIKWGGKHYNKFRDRYNYRYRIAQWAIPGNIQNPYPDEFDWQFTSFGEVAMLPFIDPGYEGPKNFLDGRFEKDINVYRDLVNAIWAVNGPHNYHEYSIHAQRNNYEANERLSAGYVMAELEIGRRLMILPGIRYEQEHSDYQAVDGLIEHPRQYDATADPVLRDTTESRYVGTWHPMIQARYRLLSWFDIRAARTVSLSRPSFSHVSPRKNINVDGREIVRGHTQIEPTKSTNYDLFFTFHTNRLGLLTIGGFYKNVEDLIYERNAVVVGQDEAQSISTEYNVDRFRIYEPVNNEYLTTVYGYELEWQSNLSWLPRPLSGLVVNANFSRMFSETQYPQFYFERQPGVGLVPVDTIRIGNMVHQPDYVANSSVGYDYKNFSARVSMQYQGATLHRVGARPVEDDYTDDYLRFDVSVYQRFFDGMTTVYLELQNITNRADRANRFTRTYPTDREYYGFMIDVGMRFRL